MIKGGRIVVFGRGRIRTGPDGRKTEEGQACPQRRKADRADRGAHMIFWWRRQIFTVLKAVIALPTKYVYIKRTTEYVPSSELGLSQPLSR